MPRRTKPVLKLSDVTLPKDYDMHRDGISQSLLSIFPLCRQKFLLKVNRWKKPDSDIFVTFGNICHDVFEWAYKRGKFPTKKVLSNLIDKSCRKMESHISTYALDELEANAALAQIVLEEYFLFYRTDFRRLKFEQLEKIFEVKFHGFKLKGKKDGLFREKVAKGFLRKLMEHKTKNQIKETLLEAVLNFDFQNLFYITSEEIENGKTLSHVCYNIVRKPGLRQGKNEDVSTYFARVRKDIKLRPEFYFVRYNISYLPQDKEIFRNELKFKLEEAELFLKGKLPLYKNQMACEVPYRCEYIDACASGNLRGYVQGSTLFPEL